MDTALSQEIISWLRSRACYGNWTSEALVCALYGAECRPSPIGANARQLRAFLNGASKLTAKNCYELAANITLQEAVDAQYYEGFILFDGIVRPWAWNIVLGSLCLLHPATKEIRRTALKIGAVPNDCALFGVSIPREILAAHVVENGPVPFLPTYNNQFGVPACTTGPTTV